MMVTTKAIFVIIFSLVLAVVLILLIFTIWERIEEEYSIKELLTNFIDNLNNLIKSLFGV